MAKNGFCHVEWSVTDLARAKAFYGGMFEWTFEAFGEGYLMFTTPNKELGGGLMSGQEIPKGGSPCVYIEVDSIEAYCAKVGDFGGGVFMGKTEIPGMGWFAILTDPDGNCVGIFESARKE